MDTQNNRETVRHGVLSPVCVKPAQAETQNPETEFQRIED
jgi:hypothetical protein